MENPLGKSSYSNPNIASISHEDLEVNANDGGNDGVELTRGFASSSNSGSATTGGAVATNEDSLW